MLFFMKAKILYLASILVALSGMLVVPGMAVKEADACPGAVCLIRPEGMSGQGDPQADMVEECERTDCVTCCEEYCPNMCGSCKKVGDPQCYCTVAGQHQEC